MIELDGTFERKLLREVFPDRVAVWDHAGDVVPRIAGCDEAGRGPLAGPVVAAAVVLRAGRVPRGLDDSKRLKAATRERLFAEILANAEVGVSTASPRLIERLDIRRASLDAMRRAVLALPRPAELVLFDGLDVPDLAGPAPNPHAILTRAVVGGDGLAASIAAASVVAKVLRDRLMARLGAEWPAYGFERHAGYPTAAHRAALIAHGPCPHHRRTFAPVRAALRARGEPD